MVSATVDYHRERSRHFLALVDEELARGELEEASNKVWGAAAHAIKAVAERRGWQHHAHALLEVAVDRLVNEEFAPARYLDPIHDCVRFPPKVLRKSCQRD